MENFKIGDKVKVIYEQEERYVSKVDIIERIEGEDILGKRKIYLKGCHLSLGPGVRLYFYESELELVKEFYWKKKSDNERI